MHRLIPVSLLIIGCVLNYSALAQQVIVDDIGLDAPVKYSARDSIVIDLPNQIIRLYGDADLKYESVHLTADLIEIDIVNSEVQATYSEDSLGNPIGKPVFTDGTENVVCDAMKYNFKTEKALITEVRTQQGEGYTHMQTSKRQPNEELHFKHGKYTTCDKEKPHYHFELTKAIVVPDKRIVTGPVYMRILNVPLPLAAPFAFLPNSDTKKNGLILPRFALAGQFGSGIENLGYYLPLGEKWETYLYGTVFTSGRWGVNGQVNYNVKYKHSGSFRLGFEHLKGYFFEEDISNNFSIFWNHFQDVKAHPSLRFSANIDFQSNNNPKQSIEIIAQDQFNTAFNSGVSLNKSWKLDELAGSWTTKLSLQQNAQSGNFVFELPSFNLSVNRFDLGVLRKSKIGKKWYENIAVTYTLTSLNRVSVADSIARASFSGGDLTFLGDNNSSGIRQNAIVQTNLKPKSGWFTFNLTTNYTENWNFQTFTKAWNPLDEKIDTVAFNDGFASNRNVRFSGGLNTNLYGYYRSKLKNGLKLRHVMSPNVTFTYRPDLGQHREIIIDTLGTLGYYSPFDISLYREAAKGESGVLSFSLGNTLEMKKRSKKDTINQSFDSFKLIDRFNINSSYDMLKDSLNLSDIRFSFQTTPVKFISLQSGWVLSPYEWDKNTGTSSSAYAWNTDQGIGTLTSFNYAITSGYDIKSEKTDTLKNFKNSDWTFDVTYNLNRTRRTNIEETEEDKFTTVHTINLNGTASLWDLWSINYDFITDLTVLSDFNSFLDGTSVLNPTFRFGVTRQLHCWQASLNFQKNGNFIQSISNKVEPSYIIRFKINIKSSMFDAFLPEVTPRIPRDWIVN